MIQIYANNVAIADGSTIPFNTTTFYKGTTATVLGNGTFALNKKGVYLVKVDGYGTAAAAGTFGIQIVVNGIPRLDAINQMTVAATDIGTAATEALVVVPESNCPCDCTATATTVSVIIPTGSVDITEGHFNLIITKVC